MSNLNNREAYNRETQRDVYRDSNGETNQNVYRDRSGESRQEVYRDRNGNLHTPATTTRTPLTNGYPVDPARSNPTAYRDGYTQGRVIEQQRQVANLRERDNDNAARGLLIGIVLTSLAGLALGSIFLFTQRNPAPAPASSPVAPTAPANPPTTNRETTIIERNTTRVIPVPQEPTAPPNVNITVPSNSQQAPTQTNPNQPTLDPAQPSQGTSGSSQNNGASPITPVTPQGSAGTDATGSSTAPSN